MYRRPNGLPGLTWPRHDQVRAEVSLASPARPTCQAESAHGLHKQPKHNPIRLRPCWADPKARQPIVLLHRISLIFIHHLFGLSYMARISPYCISFLWVLPYITGINLFCIPQIFFFDCAVLSRPTVPRHQRGTGQLQSQASTSPTSIVLRRACAGPNGRVVGWAVGSRPYSQLYRQQDILVDFINLKIYRPNFLEMLIELSIDMHFHG